MLIDIVEKLKPLLLNFDLICEKVNDNLYYFESKKYNIAYDVVNHDGNISIDFIYRKGSLNKEFILKKYPNIQGNKCRLITLFNNCSYETVYVFIKNEYLELVYQYDNLNKNNYYSIDKDKKLIIAEPLKFWFADGIPNFGDFVTPWLASYFTNRPILNVRNIPSSEGAILGVGSIVQAFGENHKKIKVWGSGIISADNHLATATKLKKTRLDHVYACRGELTKKFFNDYDFSHSNILGDPALLFGKLYEPKKNKIKKYKYAIIPHYIHFKIFEEMKIKDCIIVDVRNELTSVIDQIANSEKVISTSMHGLIIAQSYNIPWLHLYINNGRLLMGEEFKFEDFFSILNREKVSQFKINKSDININTVMGLFNSVSLPDFKKNYSENGLIDSFYDCLEGKKNNILLKKIELPKLLFIGDSHIELFKFGATHDLYKPFQHETCMASGATASGLQNTNSFTRASEKFKDFISKHSKNSEIIIQLGEVDCGILIWLKANEANITPEQQMQISLQSYNNFLTELIELGYKNILITSATLPTINDEDSVGEIISIRRQKVKATFKERTQLTLKFNTGLKEICNILNLKFIDASGFFLDPNTQLCNTEFRNKDKTDHHMDNHKASLVWANKINSYLFNKYDISSKKMKMLCKQDSFIKKFKISSKILDADLVYEIMKGDVIEIEKYSHDNYYAYAKLVTVNENKILNSDFKFIHISHFSVI